MKRTIGAQAALLIALNLPTTALAQANANATTGASDAFGFKSGEDSVGIYDESSVRGFSLEAAGNYRFEGSYFVKNAGVSNFFLESTTVRIGYNTLNTILPGPSGVVDFKLRDPARGEPSYINLTLDAYAQPQAEFLLKHRSKDDSKSLAFGVSRVFDVRDQQGGEGGKSLLIAGTGRLSSSLGTLRIFGGEYRYERPGQFRIQVQGAELPPEIERTTFLGQRWAMEQGQRRIAGVLADTNGKGDFGAGATLVFAQEDPTRGFLQLFGNAAGDGSVRSIIVASPSQRSTAWSGELRGHYQRQDGDFAQRIDLTVRGRRQRAHFGVSTIVDLGRVEFGEAGPAIDEPEFPHETAQSREKVDQWGLGATYRASVGDLVRINLGLLRTDYEKSFTNSENVQRTTKSKPLLYNVSAAWRPFEPVELYGSYIKGLEEAGVAPASAANRFEVLDPITVTQRELGIRLFFLEGLTAVIAGFDTRKPYLGLEGNTNVYRQLGHVRHRGLEASVSGRPAKGVSLVAGGFVMDPSLSGPAVEQGLIGSRPVGVPKWRGIASVDYALPGTKGLSLDSALTLIGNRVARSASLPDGSQLKTGTSVSANLGARYSFRIGETILVARAQVLNVFNQFGWEPTSAESLNYTAPRRFKLVLTGFI